MPARPLRPVAVPRSVARLALVALAALVVMAGLLSTSAAAATGGVARFALKPGGMPGYAPKKAFTSDDLDTWVDKIWAGQSKKAKAEEAERLDGFGFVAGSWQQIAAARKGGGEGIDLATEFANVAGAEAMMNWVLKSARSPENQKPGTVFKTFPVPGLAHAKGFQFVNQAKGLAPAANVVFRVGKVTTVIGAFDPAGEGAQEAVLAAVAALKSRL